MPAERQRSAEDLTPPKSPDTGRRGETLPLPVATLFARFAQEGSVTVEVAKQRIFREALYPAARWLAPLLRLKRGHFDPDWRFVSAAGCATTMEEFQTEVRHYSDDKAHRGFLRGRLKLRVSVRRLRRLARELLPPPAAGAKTSTASVTVPASDRVTSADRTEPALRVLGSGWAGVERRRAPSLPLPRPTRPPQTDETVRRLEQEVAQLKQQREILTKAVGIIAQTGQSLPPAPEKRK